MIDLLLEIDVATSPVETELLSVYGSRTSTGRYEARIESMTDLARAVRPAGGVSPAQSCRVTIADADGAWKARVEDGALKRAPARVYLTLDGVASRQFTGRVESTRTGKDTVELELRDATLDVLRETIPLRVFPDLFPNMPVTTPVAPIPIPLGTLDSDAFDKAGCVPAYLVDPAIGAHGKFRYVAAQIALKAITAVYREGIEVASGWATTYAAVVTPYGNVRMTFIDFDEDQREAGRERDIRITYDCEGLTDDGLESGALIEDIPDAVVALLSALVTSPLEAGDFAATASANAAYATAGIDLADNGLAVNVQESSWLNAVDALAESFNPQLYQDGDGVFACRFDDGSAPSEIAAGYVDSRDIVEGSWRSDSPEDVASTLEFFYAHGPGGRPTARNEYTDAATLAALARDVRRTTRFSGVRNTNAGLKMAQIDLWQERPERRTVRFTAPPVAGLEPGDGIEVTHFGAEGGWSAVACRLLRVALTLDRARGILHDLTAIDAPGISLASPAESEETRTVQTLPPPGSEIYSDIVWSAPSASTVSWTGGDITISGGGVVREFAGVAAGGPITIDDKETLYIYFAPDVNTAALQTTHTRTVAVRARRWLMAVCRRGLATGQNAQIDNRAGFVRAGGETTVRRDTGDTLEEDSIRESHLRVASVTATRISVANLSAISADMGSITAGTITGATIRTSAVNPRVEITSAAGLTTYSDVGTVLLNIPTGLSSSRLRIAASDTEASRGEIHFGSYATAGDPGSAFTLRGKIFCPLTDPGLRLMPPNDQEGSVLIGGTASRWMDVSVIAYSSSNVWAYRSSTHFAAAQVLTASSGADAVITAQDVAARKAQIWLESYATTLSSITFTTHNEARVVLTTDLIIGLSATYDRIHSFLAYARDEVLIRSRYDAETRWTHLSMPAASGTDDRTIQIYARYGARECGIGLIAKSTHTEAGMNAERITFYSGGTAVAKQTVTGSRGANAALESLCTALANLNLITNSTT